jgi:enoyl-CoA hydratase/carnithine racemase
MNQFLQIAPEGRLLHVALNRPEKRNALNSELCRELVAVLHDADADPAVGAILLTGNGKVFCAGMDLTEVLTPVSHDLGRIHERLFTVYARLTKPLVMAVQGAALAGGTGLVANAHVVIAAEDATFGLTEIRLGLWPFFIFASMERAVGERRTIELSLTGRIFPAAEALAYGLVHHVVPAAEVPGRSREIAGALAVASPTAVQMGLHFVKEIRGRGWEVAGEIAARDRAAVFQSDDFREGIQAFREKRQPKWPSLETS